MALFHKVQKLASRSLAGLFVAAALSGTMLALLPVLSPVLPVSQVLAADPCPKQRFFGLPPWYEYLKYEHANPDLTGRCEVIVNSGNILQNIWPIGLAVLDMVLVAAGIAAVGFVIFGGVKYVLSQGEPDKTKEAKETIINAIVGGTVAMLATAIVSFIGNRLGG